MYKYKSHQRIFFLKCIQMNMTNGQLKTLLRIEVGLNKYNANKFNSLRMFDYKEKLALSLTFVMRIYSVDRVKFWIDSVLKLPLGKQYNPFNDILQKHLLWHFSCSHDVDCSQRGIHAPHHTLHGDFSPKNLFIIIIIVIIFL